MSLLCNIRELELEGFFGEEKQITVILLLYPLNIFPGVQLNAWQPSGVLPWVCIQQSAGLTHCPLITPDQRTLIVSQEWKWPMLGRVLATKIQTPGPGKCYGGDSSRTGWEQCCQCMALLKVGLDPQTERASEIWDSRAVSVLYVFIRVQMLRKAIWSEGKSMKTPTCDYAKCKVCLDACAFSLRWLSHDYKKPIRDKSVVMQSICHVFQFCFCACVYLQENQVTKREHIKHYL